LLIRLNEYRLLEDVLDVPIATYTLAMRIATKYSMSDVQVAITKVIQIPPKPRRDLRTEISLLAFVAEFPSYFAKSIAIQVFINASSINFHPTADDVMLLMAYPAFLVLMMQHREGLRDPAQAIWKPYPYGNVQTWLDKKFESFGFKPRA
jgi:hypothetical protein